jgi:hypothetical protein
MFTGKRFRLKSDTLAIESSGERRIAVTVPAKEISKSYEAHDRTISE